MPTGYTHGVQNGSITEFSDFAIRCARAMGALIMMRDEPTGAPIPDKFELNTEYHDKGLKAVKAQLQELDDLTDAEANSRARATHKKNVEEFHRRAAARETERIRYKTMLEKVEGWVAPTTDHYGLKKFMIEQLTESIDWDCSTDYQHPEALTGKELVKQLRETYKTAIDTHTNGRNEEIERIGARQLWIDQLRESLGV